MFTKYKSIRSIWVLIILSIIPFFLLLLTPRTQSQPALVIANIAGYIGLMLFSWEVVLGSRFLVGKLTNRVIKIISIHKWLGIYATLLILLHPILLTTVYLKDIFWVLVPSVVNEEDLFINFGRVAFWLFLIIWLTSKPIRRFLSYRWWIRLHYLSYPLMFYTLIHPFIIGTFLKENILLQALLYTLIFGLIILILFRLCFWAGFYKYNYKVFEITKYDESFTIKLKAINGFITPDVGQYIYLQTRRFGEAHPFSIMDYDSSNGDLKLLIKPYGKMSKALQELSSDHNVYIDGAYGDFGQEANSTTSQLFIAGGVGSTVFYNMAKVYPNNSALIICNHNDGMVAEENKLIQTLGSRYYQFVSVAKLDNSPNTSFTRLNQELLAGVMNSQPIKPEQYFICGSKNFNLGIIEYLAELGINKKQIFFEDFE
jgi:predicted ferric reductase